MMKKIYLIAVLLFVAACSGGSDSGGVDETPAGDMLPANFVGTYNGTLNYRAKALSVSESGSYSMSITVFSDGTIRFDGDDPDETFSGGISNSGAFSVNYVHKDDDCEGTIGITGTVDGTTATGAGAGGGECNIKGLKVDVELEGDFTATK